MDKRKIFYCVFLMYGFGLISAYNLFLHLIYEKQRILSAIGFCEFTELDRLEDLYCQFGFLVNLFYAFIFYKLNQKLKFNESKTPI